MGDQNHTSVSLYKTITEEIEGFNAFFNEICVELGDVWTTPTLIAALCEDILGTIQSVLEETESGPTMEEIKSLISSLNDLHDLVDEDMDSSTKETILAKMDDLQKTIIRSGIQGKVKELKQGIEKAGSTAKKVVVKDKFWWWWW